MTFDPGYEPYDDQIQLYGPLEATPPITSTKWRARLLRGARPRLASNLWNRREPEQASLEVTRSELVASWFWVR